MSKELYLDDLYKEQRAPRNEYYNTDKVELLTQPDQRESIKYISQPEISPTLSGESLRDAWKDGYDAGARLSQPEQTEPDQEPVAWMQDDIELYVQEEKDVKRGYIIPLYLAPPKREPLTAAQIDKIFNSQLKEYGQLCDKSDFELFASSIEKAHGIW